MKPMPPDFRTLEHAAAVLRDVAVETPVVRSPELDAAVGAAVYVKPECLQVSGSFKFRGAYYRLSQLDEAQRRSGVVAWSSGNHAQGVAAAAARLGIRATIVMPADAPQVKIANTRRLGAEIVFYDRATESREAIARRLVAERGSVLVPSYDDPHVIAGQGTLGLEFARQLEARGVTLDALVVCCGGGGLVGGTALAMSRVSAATKVYSAEPAGFDDHARSLATGRRVANAPGATSICDALLAPEPGELTWQLNGQLLAGGLVVDDDEVRAAMRFAFRELKLVVEPGGAVALAAVLAGRLPAGGRHVGVVLSGGNVDPELYAATLAA